jgi:hypothetical protein
MLSILYILISSTFFNMMTKEEDNTFNETIKNFYNNYFLKFVWLLFLSIIIKSLYDENQIEYVIDQVYNIVHPCFYFLIITSVVTFYGTLIIGGMCFTEPLY